MTGAPSPFGWINLELLFRNPNEFPTMEISRDFPLFPLLTATAIVILVDQKDIFNQVMVQASTTNKPKSQKKVKDAPLMETPSFVFEILYDSKKLYEWIKAIRSSLKVAGREHQRSAEQDFEHIDHKPNKKSFVDCSTLYSKAQVNMSAGEGAPLVQSYGLLSRHFTALSVLEHLELLFRDVTTGHSDRAQQHFHDCVGAVLLYSDRSYYLTQGWLPPEAGFHPTRTILQQIQAHNPDANHRIPLKIQQLMSERLSWRQPPRSKKLRQEWEVSERIRLLSKRDDLIHLISGLNKSLFKFQSIFGPMRGALENRKAAQAYQEHVKSLVLPLLKEYPNLPWASPKRASNEVCPRLIEKLKSSPFQPHSIGERPGNKKPRATMTPRRLEEIFSEMAPGFPELFSQEATISHK